MNPNATDWDSYYKKPASLAGFTRKISASKILNTLGTELSKPGLTICELGGANSCFIDYFLPLPNLTTYDVIDLNQYGIELLDQRFREDKRVRTKLQNALELGPEAEKYDIVYSVGLIEHFDVENTARCVAAHFHLCQPGGLVLITFPTPTIPYRMIRGIAERLGVWAFPDERPLQFSEVKSASDRFGSLTHESINWGIGLTQGYVVFRAATV